MGVTKKKIIGLAHRLAYASLASAAVWIAIQLPLAEGTYPPTRWGVGLTIARWLDLPIAAATQVLPCRESAIDLWFRVRCPDSSGDQRRFLLNHMRVGVPTYLLIFYLPTIYRMGRDGWRHRRGRGSTGIRR